MPKNKYPRHADDDLVGSREVCEYLEIDRSTLTRWVAAGRLHPHMQLPGVNGAFVFRWAEVLRCARDEVQTP